MDKDTPPRASRNSQVVDNPWRFLRKFTTARIGLGRAGISQPTQHHLDFQLAHARARDAVHSALDMEKMQLALDAHGYESVLLHSSAMDRSTYLQRPDMGRRLDQRSVQQLEARKPLQADAYDVAFVIADGLSAFAVERHALPFLNVMMPKCRQENWRLAPLTLVQQGRVAISDEIGMLLGARLVAILIGERPGLSSPDSLGIYMTYGPRIGKTDVDRNCISNVRSEGLSYEMAAHKLFYLISEALRRRLSGVNLKDEAAVMEKISTDAAGVTGNFLVEKT